ncbi:hypothetical protein KVR01_004360 [Diaporthe batatas]|uniref:uncharacterized protein n=1 Tax=Diaporthe batatas TaxID=748121 RepID=UPI001D043DB3|nr:uncharacterized protein KVR01_004360 [Diaporthe batatas]KAG8165808.1 hypothetical protein KVR01_004360 [Diaporthe batatas]
MAETFHPFPDLPKELRLKIWEQALTEARPDRRIIVYESRVVPFKQSISSLLLVNYESRTCAKAFYDVKLDVYAIPSLTDCQIERLDKKTHWERFPDIERAVDGKIHGYTDEVVRMKFNNERFTAHKELSDDLGRYMDDRLWNDRRRDTDDDLRNYRRLKKELLLKIDLKEKEYTVDLEEHWAAYVEERLWELGSESAAKAETSGLSKGAFYISPEHDIFIDGYECGKHFFNIDDASKIFGTTLEPRLTCRHISETLCAATRERVSTPVEVTRGQPTNKKPHCAFRDNDLLEYCPPYRPRGVEDNYPSITSYFSLTPYSFTPPGFLQQLIEADGTELSKILGVWVKTGNLYPDKPGRVFWTFTQTKGFTCHDPLLKHRHSVSVDWTHEMMAHWRVGQARVLYSMQCMRPVPTD